MSNIKSALTELRALVEGRDDPKEAPLPLPSEVLYEGPLPGGENRKCSNCVFWVEPHRQCSLMDTTVRVLGNNLCGLHVGGKPSQKRWSFPGLVAVEPKRVGFVLAPNGSSCDSCTYYTATDDAEGVCAAIKRKQRSDAPPRGLHVEAKGCCTRWKQKSDIVLDPDQPGR